MKICESGQDSTGCTKYGKIVLDLPGEEQQVLSRWHNLPSPRFWARVGADLPFFFLLKIKIVGVRLKSGSHWQVSDNVWRSPLKFSAPDNVFGVLVLCDRKSLAVFQELVSRSKIFDNDCRISVYVRGSSKTLEEYPASFEKAILNRRTPDTVLVTVFAGVDVRHIFKVCINYMHTL